jgi:hypothetical protein
MTQIYKAAKCAVQLGTQCADSDDNLTLKEFGRDRGEEANAAVDLTIHQLPNYLLK